MSETIRTSYKAYKKSAKEPVTLSEYIKITELFILFLIKKVLSNYEVSLPFGLGSMRIRGVKEKPRFDEEGKLIGLSPNWRMTKQLWDSDPEAKANKKLIFNMNDDTGGIRYKFLWSKSRIIVPYKTLYSFTASRILKRKLYSLIKSGEEFDSVELNIQ